MQLSLPDAPERSPKRRRLTRKTSSDPDAPGQASDDPFHASSASLTEDVEKAEAVPPPPNEAEANERRSAAELRAKTIRAGSFTSSSSTTPYNIIASPAGSKSLRNVQNDSETDEEAKRERKQKSRPL